MKYRVKKTLALLISVFLLIGGLSLCMSAEGRDFAETAPEVHSVRIDGSASFGPADTLIMTVGGDESSRFFTWQTDAGGQYLQWAPAGEVNGGVFPENSRTVAASFDGETCRAEMTGLESGREYLYRVGSDKAGWSDAFSLKTGSFDDGAFSFLAVGDPQLGGCLLDVDTQGWQTAMKKARSWFGDSVEFVLSAGDQTNDYLLPEEYRAFASPEVFRSTAMMTVPGNHDGDYTYSKYYTYANVDETTRGEAGEYGGDYWVGYDGVLFLMLNCIEVDYDLHRAFIGNALNEYREAYGADPNWKIASLHYSAYSAAAGRLHSDYRDEYSPIFTEYGVDAVISGHDHVYTRSYMMYNITEDSDPDHYVPVNGDPYGSVVDPEDGKVFYMTGNSGSGSKLYPLSDELLPYTAFCSQDVVPYVTKVDVTADMLVFTTYRAGPDNSLGDAVDFFAIHRRAGVEEDVYAPVLTVPQADHFVPGEEFDLTAGITAYDDLDGDISDRITVTGGFDPYGESVVTYTVTDAAGNTATAERRLIPVSREQCVTAENEWRMLDEGEMPFDILDDDTVSWTLAEYDDSGWKTAVGSFGSLAGEPAEKEGRFTVDNLISLVYPEGSVDEGETVPNYFFRTTFDVGDPDSVDFITGNIIFDDGVDVYINGVKVRTLNVHETADPWGYGNLHDPGCGAKNVKIEIKDKEFIKSLGLKKTGNVLAVELYQGVGYSDDIYFAFPSLYVGRAASLPDIPFTDVRKGSWYYLNVAKAYARGLFSGVSDTLFAPASGMTRAMVWRVITRMIGAEVEHGERWYTGSQKWVTENGISDGTMPDGAVTREQLAAMLYNLSGRPETDLSLLDAFSDASSASKWAKKGLSWAVGNGIMAGRGGGILDPKAPVTRAEACTMIIKYVEGRR